MDCLTMVISAMSVYLGVFMYKNQYSYWMAISFILLIIINLYCIFTLFSAALSEFSPKFDEALDKCKQSLISDYPCLEQYLPLSRRRRVKDFWESLKRNLLYRAKYGKLQPSPAFEAQPLKKKHSDELQLISKFFLYYYNFQSTL